MMAKAMRDAYDSIREEDIDNREKYKKLHSSRLYLPAKRTDYPFSEFIKWHNKGR